MNEWLRTNTSEYFQNKTKIEAFYSFFGTEWKKSCRNIQIGSLHQIASTMKQFCISNLRFYKKRSTLHPNLLSKWLRWEVLNQIHWIWNGKCNVAGGAILLSLVKLMPIQTLKRQRKWQFTYVYSIFRSSDYRNWKKTNFSNCVEKMSSEGDKLENDGAMDDSSPGNMDVDEEKDDNSLKAKNNDEFMAKGSMTESYSEILNSPTMETNERPIESNKPIVIQKRRPSSLTRHHSSQCKITFYLNSFD